MGAVTALAGTATVICEDELAVKVAATVPNCTAVATPRLLPEMTIESPTTPLVGEKLVIVGAPLPIRTLTLTAEDMVLAPSLSVALAVITCAPLAAFTHENS